MSGKQVAQVGVKRRFDSMPRPKGGDDDVLYRLPEAAQRLNVAVKTLRHWGATGRLRLTRLSPGSVRVSAAELNKFLAEATEGDRY